MSARSASGKRPALVFRVAQVVDRAAQLLADALERRDEPIGCVRCQSCEAAAIGLIQRVGQLLKGGVV
jgi:hypothetical protein